MEFKKKTAKFFKKLNAKLLANPFVSAILFIILCWFSISTFVLLVEKSSQDANIKTVEDSIWWGIVTLLTVGYGDKYPLTTVGRIAAAFLMVFGVIGIAIVTAKISSYFLERAMRERRGFVETSTLKNHFVICGWKREMITFLIHILDANPLMKDSDIVLINTAIDTDIESMHENPRLKHVKFIRGEYFLEVNLKRAAPERATKILILADATPGPNGKIPTITEADARTIMTAMALNNIAKGIPMAAEIIDSAMDQYLKLAHVSEIIYSRDYSRMLLAMASSGTGITNVFHDLLSPHSQSYISTKPIQHDFIGKKYGELKEHFFKESKNETLIGILENSGNSQVAKEAALKRAQLTPNISELVKNLQGVKALRFNNPYFNPDNDYLLSEGAMAIVIESRIGELKI